MSVTRILCKECGYPLCYCVCKKPLASDAVLSEVRAELQRLIEAEKEATKDQPWMEQAQYRLSGLEDALAVIDDKIIEHFA